MIEKNSLLNAYTALGSSTTHFAMLVALMTTIHYPQALIEDNYPEVYIQLVYLFQLSVVTHGLAVILAIPMKFERFYETATAQSLQMAVIFLNFWLVLQAFTVFIDLSEAKEIFAEEKLVPKPDDGKSNSFNTDTFNIDDLRKA